MVSKSPNWGCGTPSKWPNFMAYLYIYIYKWGMILSTYVRPGMILQVYQQLIEVLSPGPNRAPLQYPLHPNWFRFGKDGCKMQTRRINRGETLAPEVPGNIHSIWFKAIGAWLPHMTHGWCIYLYNYHTFKANVGEYAVYQSHGSYGC